MSPVQKMNFKFEIELCNMHLHLLMYTLTVYKKLPNLKSTL